MLPLLSKEKMSHTQHPIIQKCKLLTSTRDTLRCMKNLCHSVPCLFLIPAGPNISVVGAINEVKSLHFQDLTTTLCLAYICGSLISDSLLFCFKALKGTVQNLKTYYESPKLKEPSDSIVRRD